MPLETTMGQQNGWQYDVLLRLLQKCTARCTYKGRRWQLGGYHTHEGRGPIEIDRHRRNFIIFKW